MGEFPPVAFEQWQRRVEQELEAAGGVRALETDTLDGVTVRPLYVQCEPDGAGFPGLEPFVRGTLATPRRPAWERLQRHGGPDLGAVSERVREDVAGGVDGIWLSLAGTDGLAHVAGVLEAAFAPRRPISLMLDAGVESLPAAAVTLAALRRLGRDPAVLRVRWAADPLGALAAGGTLPAAPDRLAREAAVLVRHGGERLPRARALAVSTAPYARAGAGPPLQIACAAATALEYLRWLADAGIGPEETARQIVFSFEAGREFLLELCKLRAFRLVWSKAQRACGLEPAAPFVHASTGWRTWTRRDPYGNLLRATVQTAAAVFGGARAVTVTPFDALLPPGKPPERGAGSGRGRRLARNVHALLGEEALLGGVLDPAGGSYAVETLTEELARGAWEMLRQIEAVGMAAALADPADTSPLRRLLRQQAERRRGRLRRGTDAVLGVSHYPPPEGLELPGEPSVGASSGTGDSAAERTSGPGEGGAGRRRRSAAGTDPVGGGVPVPGVASADLDAVRDAAAAVLPTDAAAEVATAGAERLVEVLVRAASAGATLAELGAALRAGSSTVRFEPLSAWRDEEAAAAAGREAR